MQNNAPNRIPWPPLIYAGAIVLALGLAFIAPLPLALLPGPLAIVAGLMVILGAIVVDFWAMRTMTAADTTILPHRSSRRLVTGGPFRYSRNPIYVANTAIMLGAGLVAGTWWFWIIAPAAALLTQQLAIVREEKHLAEKFGDTYEIYRKRVRRWL